ncbi:hypothetical protein JCM8208_000224 [Rhodotorula glutinis]
MGAAQDAFASVCPISFAEYCSAPWQVTIDVCCGLCPSPAINAYGTLAGLVIASFFAMVIVLFQPAQSAWYIAAQLALAHMYLVAIMARNMMSQASSGVNSIQRWHAEYAFLLGSSITGTVVACVLSDTHHIHGFSTADEHDAFLDASAAYAQARASRSSSTPKHYSPHPLHLQPSDEYVRGEHLSNVARAAQRLRKWGHRHQAVLLLCAFSISELYWFVLYAATIWWPASSSPVKPVSWQSNCDDLIGAANYRLLEGTSWTFVSLALLATLLLCVPVFGHRVESAAHSIVRILSLHGETRRSAFASGRAGVRAQEHAGEVQGGTAGAAAAAPGPGGGPRRRTDTDTTKATRRSGQSGGFEFDASTETLVKVCASLVVWILWFVMVLVTLFKALDDFLLVGNSWPYAAIQNLIFGTFAAFKFFLGVVRERTRQHTKARKARRVERAVRAPLVDVNGAHAPPPHDARSSSSGEQRRTRRSRLGLRSGDGERGRRGERTSAGAGGEDGSEGLERGAETGRRSRQGR